VDALLPLAALIHEAVAQPDSGAQVEQVIGGDVGLRQPPGHQQLTQVPRVRAIGLRALLVALERARLGRLGQVRLSADRDEFLDHEPPARRGFQSHLEMPALKPGKEPPHATSIGGNHARARHLTSLRVQPLRSDLRAVLIKPHHDRHSRLLEPRTRTPAPRSRPTRRSGRHPAHAIFARRAGAVGVVSRTLAAQPVMAARVASARRAGSRPPPCASVGYRFAREAVARVTVVIAALISVGHAQASASSCRLAAVSTRA
jgi:hypothetical protein